MSTQRTVRKAIPFLFNAQEEVSYQKLNSNFRYLENIVRIIADDPLLAQKIVELLDIGKNWKGYVNGYSELLDLEDNEHGDIRLVTGGAASGIYWYDSETDLWKDTATGTWKSPVSVLEGVNGLPDAAALPSNVVGDVRLVISKNRLYVWTASDVWKPLETAYLTEPVDDVTDLPVVAGLIDWEAKFVKNTGEIWAYDLTNTRWVNITPSKPVNMVENSSFDILTGSLPVDGRSLDADGDTVDRWQIETGSPANTATDIHETDLSNIKYGSKSLKITASNSGGTINDSNPIKIFQRLTGDKILTYKESILSFNLWIKSTQLNVRPYARLSTDGVSFRDEDGELLSGTGTFEQTKILIIDIPGLIDAGTLPDFTVNAYLEIGIRIETQCEVYMDGAILCDAESRILPYSRNHVFEEIVEARQSKTTLTEMLGLLSDLETSDTDSIVGAINSAMTYDATVDTAAELSAAVDDVGVTGIFIKSGSYDISGRDLEIGGKFLIGESKHGVLINFDDGYGFTVIGDSVIKEGGPGNTVSINSGSDAISGSGTSFAVGDIGKYIHFGVNGYGKPYKIASHADSSNITLEDNYYGEDLSAVEYYILGLADAFVLLNLTVKSASGFLGNTYEKKAAVLLYGAKDGCIRGINIKDADTMVPYDITGVNKSSDAITDGVQGSKTFVVAGDQTTKFTTDKKFVIDSSTANDGVYTVASSAFDTDHTDIVVSESIPDATFDGDALINDIVIAGDQTLIFVDDKAVSVTRSTSNDGPYTVGASVFTTETIVTVIEELSDATVDGNVYSSSINKNIGVSALGAYSISIKDVSFEIARYPILFTKCVRSSVEDINISRVINYGGVAATNSIGIQLNNSSENSMKNLTFSDSGNSAAGLLLAVYLSDRSYENDIDGIKIHNWDGGNIGFYTSGTYWPERNVIKNIFSNATAIGAIFNSINIGGVDNKIINFNHTHANISSSSAEITMAGSENSIEKSTVKITDQVSSVTHLILDTGERNNITENNLQIDIDSGAITEGIVALKTKAKCKGNTIISTNGADEDGIWVLDTGSNSVIAHNDIDVPDVGISTAQSEALIIGNQISNADKGIEKTAGTDSTLIGNKFDNIGTSNLSGDFSTDHVWNDDEIDSITLLIDNVDWIKRNKVRNYPFTDDATLTNGTPAVIPLDSIYDGYFYGCEIDKEYYVSKIERDTVTPLYEIEVSDDTATVVSRYSSTTKPDADEPTVMTAVAGSVIGGILMIDWDELVEDDESYALDQTKLLHSLVSAGGQKQWQEENAVRNYPFKDIATYSTIENNVFAELMLFGTPIGESYYVSRIIRNSVAPQYLVEIKNSSNVLVCKFDDTAEPSGATEFSTEIGQEEFGYAIIDWTKLTDSVTPLTFTIADTPILEKNLPKFALDVAEWATGNKLRNFPFTDDSDMTNGSQGVGKGYVWSARLFGISHSNTYHLSKIQKDPGTSPTHAILSASAADSTFTITGDVQSDFPVGKEFDVSGSASNDGTYTVDEIDLVIGNTVITTAEAVDSDSGADGDIDVENAYYLIEISDSTKVVAQWFDDELPSVDKILISPANGTSIDGYLMIDLGLFPATMDEDYVEGDLDFLPDVLSPWDRGSTGSGIVTIAIVTGNYLTNNNQIRMTIAVNSPSAAVTITLPAIPGSDFEIEIVDIGYNASNYYINVNGNGKDIAGSSLDHQIVVDGGGYKYQYSSVLDAYIVK